MGICDDNAAAGSMVHEEQRIWRFLAPLRRFDRVDSIAIVDIPGKKKPAELAGLIHYEKTWRRQVHRKPNHVAPQQLKSLLLRIGNNRLSLRNVATSDCMSVDNLAEHGLLVASVFVSHSVQ